MNSPLGDPLVAISIGHDGYPEHPPYSPAVRYPEYPLGSAPLSAKANPAYEGVRASLRLLGLDAGRFGTPDWNPLGEFIRPGDTVVLKPNFIRDFRETKPGHGDCLITHGSVIRAVLDFVYVALRGNGRIVIADAPQDDADFQVIRRIAGLDEIRELYRRETGFDVDVYDLRPERAIKVDGVIVGHEALRGDPAGYVKVDLGRHSMFTEIDHLCGRLYGAEYDKQELRRHHRPGVHEYLISKTILDADCVISLPKLKTHKKTGITVSLKNMVGMNGNKNWLPHHREGTPCQGGDEFADDGLWHRAERMLTAGFKRVFPRLGRLRSRLAGPTKALGRRLFGDTNAGTIRSGNWYGNDTAWRMVLDLNRILLYADSAGRLHDEPVRKVFSLVDGIIGGQGNGPLDPTPKPARVIVAGSNPVAVDLTCARLMGFDCRRLPMLGRALVRHGLPFLRQPVDQVTVTLPGGGHRVPVMELAASIAFEPHFGWRGHVESRRSSSGRAIPDQRDTSGPPACDKRNPS